MLRHPTPTVPYPAITSPAMPATLEQVAVAKETANTRMQEWSLSWAGGSQIHSSFKGRGNQSFPPGVCTGVRVGASISAARQAIVCPWSLG